MTPEEAENFYVEDEDQGPLFAAYDAARAAYERKLLAEASRPLRVAPAGQPDEAGNFAMPVFAAPLVDLVLDAYGSLSAHQLSVLTHQEPPWRMARKRAHAADMERSSEPLSDLDMSEFFEAMISADSDACAEG